MKATIKTTQEVEVKLLHVDAGVRYWEDATVNGVEDESGDLIPFREDDRWKPVIDIDEGCIINWPEGTTAQIHYKVCDDGIYVLQDANGEKIAHLADYVPEIMCPGGKGYGDYIIMNVDGNGLIENFEADLSAFNVD